MDRRFRIGHGRLFALYVAAYCFGRFWVELMRSDMATHIAGIRINSFVSVFVFIGAVVYIMVAPKGREDPSELRGYADDDDHAPAGANLPTEKIEKELIAVAAATGVVAAAKAAGEKEDEDATEVIDSGGDEPSDVEAVVESEQLAQDVAEAPAGELVEAEAFAEAGEESEPTVAIGGVGAVEGDEVAAAEESAPEVHDDAVENAEEAADVADEVAAESDDEVEAPATDGVRRRVEAEAEDAADAEDDAEAEAGDESPPRRLRS